MIVGTASVANVVVFDEINWAFINTAHGRVISVSGRGAGGDTGGSVFVVVVGARVVANVVVADSEGS